MSIMSSMYEAHNVDAQNSFRLLQIEGIDANGTINTSLKAYSFGSRPHYHFLSYTWANALGLQEPGVVEDSTIFCDGQPALVHPNLHEALCTLASSEYQHQLFWIDAICIDQENSVEKAAQLLLMPQICRCADSVIAFLGPEDADTAPAIALINRVGKMRQQERQSLRPSTLSHPDSIRLLGEVGAQIQSWKSVAHLFCRSYFHRAWIVPEILNAAALTVFCGQSELSWIHLVKMSDLLCTSEWTILFNDPSFLGQGYMSPQHDCPAKLRATRYQQLSGENTLLSTLIRTRPYLCKDPRDKVFSLMPKSDIVNYDLSLGEVYTRAAIVLLKQSDDLLLLAHVEGQDYSTLGDTASSWVPDWSCSRTLGLGITGYKRYWAAGQHVRRMTFSENGLNLTGKLIATVTDAGLTKEEVRNGQSCLSWLQLVGKALEQSPYAQSAYEVLWRVLIADTAPHCPAPKHLEDSFTSWLIRKLWPHIQAAVHEEAEVISLLGKLGFKWSGLDSQEFLKLGTSSIDVQLADKFESLFGHSMCNRLFVTDTHHVGIGTTSLQTGDQVFLVCGSRVPLLFRPQPARSGEYKLVGGCYLHGAMHGELFNETSCSWFRVV
ncbi:hypothetical protein AMS68_003700 [Peltaster fructicola]|uniref:Heterokaryon incompatibility domain-containing protein n=1 Tax=Peltaster fructicola TaxID=286661 RepID=A0A6H0XTY7_9PEZI|nr:hypothetical protein AMS68_003700 [Peltaster fructicola]